jgi:hypothetical protein
MLGDDHAAGQAVAKDVLEGLAYALGAFAGPHHVDAIDLFQVEGQVLAGIRTIRRLEGTVADDEGITLRRSKSSVL